MAELRLRHSQDSVQQY